MRFSNSSSRNTSLGQSSKFPISSISISSSPPSTIAFFSERLSSSIKAQVCFFFLSGFSSQTLTIHRTAGEVRGSSVIPLYHFHPLTNIETLICNFAREMTITYFLSQRLCLPDYYTMRFTTLSNCHLSD